MEYVMKNTDVFDEAIDAKFRKLFIPNVSSFEKDKAYDLIVSFHVNLLYDPRFETFKIEVPSKTNRGTKEDNIYDALSQQLHKIEQVLIESDVKSYSTTIQGVSLESESMIKVEIYEEAPQKDYLVRGRNKQRMKAVSIIPNKPGIQEKASELASEILGKMYCDFADAIRNKKIMSEILEIEPTEDDKLLINAFVKQYGELWLAMGEKKKELLNRLEERCLSVVNKYTDKEK